MTKIRILFYFDDFKTESWSRELENLGCEVIRNSSKRLKLFPNTLYHAKAFAIQFFKRKKINAFVFRYLNDSVHLRLSIAYLFRDLINVGICKLQGTKMIWLMHNIDKETIVSYPFINKIRRKIVRNSCERVLVTDPHLIEFAVEYGIEKENLDWLSFGEPDKKLPDKRNECLKNKIKSFKESFYESGIKNVIVGLCVSEPAKKKVHYLYADTITGPLEDEADSCVLLVMIGNFPDGDKYDEAKEKVDRSPYIMHIDEAFTVNEDYISEHIDFFYRSMTDHSIAYTVYVACALGKPLVTHNTGALANVIQKEKIGFVLHRETFDSKDMFRSIKNWSPEDNMKFLKSRSWKIGAKRLLKNIHQTGL